MNNLITILILVLVIFIVFNVYRNLTRKFIEETSAVITNISSSCGWSGVKSFQVEVTCEKYNITTVSTVDQEYITSHSIGDKVFVLVSKDIFNKHYITIDFSK